jgi:hypothetical protein
MDGYMNFPMIRRMHYQSFAKSLVSVQPMTAPSGNIFYMDYTYGEESVVSAIKESSNLAATFVFLIRNKDNDLVRNVIVKKFPEHLEQFDKLLALK